MNKGLKCGHKLKPAHLYKASEEKKNSRIYGEK